MSPEAQQTPTRIWIARAFSAVEDLVYVGLGVVLAGGAIALLVSAVMSFAHSLMGGSLAADIISLLDRILLILLIVELLYTVQVSFREHTVKPEPFLLVGLIAVIRRVLVLTAELGHGGPNIQAMGQYFLLELAVLAGLIVALAASLFALHRQDTAQMAQRVPSPPG